MAARAEHALTRHLATGVCLVLGLAGCAALGPGQGRLAGVEPRAGAIYEVASGRLVDQAELLESLAGADFVLLGESHDDPLHHRLQAQLVRALARAGAPPAAVAFEMIPTDRQLAVVEYLEQRPDDARDLGPATGWQQRGWPDFAQYAPIVQAALDAGAVIVAGDLPGAQQDRVLEHGARALRTSFVRRTGLDQKLPAPLAVGLRQELLQSHCGEVAAGALEGMSRVQRARDAMLADRLAAVSGRQRGVLIAGRGHVRTDRGVPWYLRRLRPDARIVSLAFIEVDEAHPGSSPETPFDYVWFTPSIARDDPCAGYANRSPATAAGERS
ncbi:MAG: ChaN family lipoprotein [Geminicoccaceae bacterium]